MGHNSVEQLDQHTILKDYDEFSKLFCDLFSELLVCYNLDSLYYEDSSKALDLLKQNMKEEELSFEKRALVVVDFQTIREKILEKIDSVDEDDNEEMIMLLFYIVHSFESIVNQHIYFELENKGLTRGEIDRVIQRLATSDKLGWLLKIICSKEYTSNNEWSLLNKFIRTRNFYIHYSPDTFEAHDKHELHLNKKSFASFLDYAYDCYLFLKECESTEVKDKLQRVQNLKGFMKNEFEERKALREELEAKNKSWKC